MSTFHVFDGYCALLFYTFLFPIYNTITATYDIASTNRKTSVHACMRLNSYSRSIHVVCCQQTLYIELLAHNIFRNQFYSWSIIEL